MTLRPRFFRLTFRPRFCNSSSYQGNQLEKKMGGCTARLFAQNFDARLAGIVIWADGPCFTSFTRGPWNQEILTKTQKDACWKYPGACFFRKKSACGSAHTDGKGLYFQTIFIYNNGWVPGGFNPPSSKIVMTTGGGLAPWSPNPQKNDCYYCREGGWPLPELW